jgi:glycopeptide antibiotics resistance protein
VTTGIFSLLIEMIQFAVGVGTFDVDDVILNTLGGVLGYFMFRVLFAIFFKCYSNGKN